MAWFDCFPRELPKWNTFIDQTNERGKKLFGEDKFDFVTVQLYETKNSNSKYIAVTNCAYSLTHRETDIYSNILYRTTNYKWFLWLYKFCDSQIAKNSFLIRICWAVTIHSNIRKINNRNEVMSIYIQPFGLEILRTKKKTI